MQVCCSHFRTMFRMQLIEIHEKDENRMKRVLFLCTGNSARSQMSEALLKELGGNDFDVYSAGTHIASEVNPFAIRALEEKGLVTDGLKPKRVDQFKGQSFDLVITVCDNAKQECPFFPGAKQMLHWSLEDPASFQGTDFEIMEKFREIRYMIEERINRELLGK